MAEATVKAFGIGIVKRGKGGRPLEVYYHAPAIAPNFGVGDVVAKEVGYISGNKVFPLSEALIAKIRSAAKGMSSDKNYTLLEKISESSAKGDAIAVFLGDDVPPTSVEEAYLKLALLSHRLVQPHGVNVEGIFKVLPNVAWTSEGPIEIDEIGERQLEARLSGRTLEVYSVDKFPKLVNHFVPDQVRIADGARVRFGAYLGAGTTVMQAGFINFNAGTAGPNMIEGRVSSGVFVDSGSDLGGASSTLGTLSGGNTTVIRIGKKCLIGANAGAGISLGDGSTIEAGLYVTAGSKVELLDKTGKKVGLVKAKELAGRPGLLFRRNSATGRIEALEGQSTVQLNETLHVNR